MGFPNYRAIRAFLISNLVVRIAAQGCYVASYVQGIPAENIGSALENVTCPVNTAANQLIYYSNISSISDSSSAIITCLKDSTTYMNASAALNTSADTDIFRGPLLGVPFAFSEWTSQLLEHKADIANSNIGSSLSDELTQQRDAAKTFIDTVVAKADQAQQKDFRDTLNPVVDNLNCAISAFKSGSSVTACSSSAPTATSIGGTASQMSSSTTASAASSTSTRAVAGIVSPPIEGVLASLLSICGAVTFF